MEMARFLAEADAVHEDVLRYEVSSGKFADHPLRMAASKLSLAKREEARAFAAASKRDAREEDTLAIAKSSSLVADQALAEAKEANRIASEELAVARSSAEHARSNARWAMYAAIVAALAAAISVKDQILALVFSTH